MPLSDQNTTPYASVSVFRDYDIGGLHLIKSLKQCAHPITGFQLLPEGQVILLNTGYRADVRRRGWSR